MANPVLNNAVDKDNWLGEGEAYESMQLNDVIVITALSFAVLAASAGITWWLEIVNVLVLIGAMLAALGVSIWGIRRPGPVPTLIYAVLEGVAMGMLSLVFAESYGSDIVANALLATAVTFAVCLGVYLFPPVRHSNQGRRIFLVLLIAFLVFSVINLALGIFTGFGGGMGVYGLGAIGIGVAFLALLLSAWGLVVDFGMVDDAVESGAPRSIAWALSLGLMVSVVWVYVNMLRLMGLARGR